MSGLSPVPRRVRTPSWLDPRLGLGVALVVASVLLGAVVLSRARHTDPRVALAHDLSAGARLTAEDLVVVRTQLPDSARQVYAGDVASVIGKQLNRPIARGELVPVSALAPLEPASTVSVPLEAGSAPDLRAGEVARFWVSTKTCRAAVLIGQTTLQQVGEASGSFTSDGGQDVVLSLPPELASRVVDALALPDVKVRAAVLSGPADSHANDALPSLDPCGETGS